MKMTKRNFLKYFISLVGIGTGLYAWKIEPHWLEFVQLKMPIKNLPDSLVGKTLMQISDVHIGHTVHKNFLSDSFQKAKKFQPDFVVYTGDFISYKSKSHLEQMKEIMANAVYGKYATLGVLGNHDYGHKWSEPKVADKITEILKELGIDILRNEQTQIEGLNIIGIDDFWGTNFYPEKVMSHIQKEAANLVLCHNPDVADEPVWNGFEGWILSGHTHGGQCKPPFLPPPLVPVKNKRYSHGIVNIRGNRTLYINRALGNLHHIRFNVRPEITIFELEKA